MRLLAVAVALAGCGRIDFAAGGDGDASVPDGFVAPCAGPDEDGDLWPDACDNCPTEPNFDQADGGDFDLVGDACDPRPTIAGDRIFFFDNFDTPDPRYWFFDTATYVGGRLRLGTVTGTGQAFFETPTTVTRIDVAYEILDHQTVGTAQWIGVWSDIGPDPLKLFSETAYDPDAPLVFTRIKEMTPATDRYSLDIETAGPWVKNQPYRTVTDIGSTYRLTVWTPGQPPRTTELAMTIPRGDQAFLEAERVEADFRYVIVYFVP